MSKSRATTLLPLHSVVAFQLLTAQSIVTKRDGERIFHLWKQHAAELLPEHFGNWEPVRNPFDPENLASALDAWNWPFLARRKKPRVDASIFPRQPGMRPLLHSVWSMWIQHGVAHQACLVALLRAAAVVLEADYACVHILTPREISRGSDRNTVLALDSKRTKFMFDVRSDELQRAIPDLYWATVLGPPYVEMFGRSPLLSTPVFRAEMLRDDIAFLQISPSLHDFGTNIDSVEQVRSTAIAHLGAGAFRKPGDDTAVSYRTPKFWLDPNASKVGSA